MRCHLSPGRHAVRTPVPLKALAFNVTCTTVRPVAASNHDSETEAVILRVAAPSSGLLLDLVSQLLEVDEPAAAELIALGAVWFGETIKGQGIKWRRAAAYPSPNQLEVLEGQMLKLHPEPKRYAACHTSDWQSRLVYMDEDYVVVNKPAGLSCMPHESNCKEHLQECVAAALGMGTLQACHRLDEQTTGVVVLGRHKEAIRTLTSDMAAGGAVQKTYAVFTEAAVPLGRLRHYMYDGPFGDGLAVLAGGCLAARGPRLLSKDLPEAQAKAKWKECCLVVKECEVLHGGWQEWHRRTYPDKPLPEQLYCSKVELVTGRTHQIRAQLSAIGAPVVGDTMYGPFAGKLVPSQLGIADQDVLQAVKEAQQPSGPIGLHAEKLVWGQHRFLAPAPWQ